MLLTAAMLFGEVMVAGHDGCHDADGEACQICWYSSSPSYLSDTAPQVSIPVVEQPAVLPAVSQPSCDPLFTASPRGPPGFLL